MSSLHLIHLYTLNIHQKYPKMWSHLFSEHKVLMFMRSLLKRRKVSSWKKQTKIGGLGLLWFTTGIFCLVLISTETEVLKTDSIIDINDFYLFDRVVKLTSAFKTIHMRQKVIPNTGFSKDGLVISYALPVFLTWVVWTAAFMIRLPLLLILAHYLVVRAVNRKSALQTTSPTQITYNIIKQTIFTRGIEHGMSCMASK